MKFEDIPASLRDQEFPATGGRWVIREPFLIEITLGPKTEEYHHVVAEAHWAAELYQQLKALDRTQKWDAITSLENLPKKDNPPLEMRMMYAKIMKDVQTRRVGITLRAGIRPSPRRI